MEKLPTIVELAELVLIVADPKVEAETKARWVKSSIADGIITKEDAVELLIHKDLLAKFLDA